MTEQEQPSETTMATDAVNENNDVVVLDSKEKKRTGGIAWAGSLVGSQNPKNLGYRYSNPTKRYRKVGEETDNDGSRELPTNIQVQFRNRQGEELATTLDLPVNSTVDDLTALIHTLQEAEGGGDDDNKKIPYSFYAKIKGEDDVEVTISLHQLLTEYPEISTETILELTYQPLAVFRVRPVTRCTDTLQGHTEAILHVQYSPSGNSLASGGGDAVVRFWDVMTHTPKFSALQHKNHVLCTAWSPDNLKFASADKNGVLIIWDPMTGKPSIAKHIKAHKQWITSIAWEPLHLCTSSQYTCDKVATASKDASIKLWNARTGSAIRTLSGHTDSVEALRWSGEGLLYSASRDRTIKVWNPERGILVRTLTGHGHRVNTLALSSDFVLRTGPFDFRLSSNVKSQLVEYKNNPKAAIASAKERYEEFQQQNGTERLVSGSDDFTLFVWNPSQSKHPVKRLTGHQQAVNHIAFSPDGRYFDSVSFDKKVKIWNGFSGDFLTTLTGHVGSVYQ